ncbi:MAG: [FeFe] hydrogenase H-cluster radical SAM maturase HydE [Candidatus Omnitrophica bacterium]|nr:[FeFe] hydrogenase H-cluster radical SAM maturase HydE [Candidatus Omnitrophota bacterium]
MNMSKLERILKRVYEAPLPEAADLERLLSLNEREDIEAIFSFADKVRREFCGDGIALRGIIEFSNFCQRECAYCGLNKGNRAIQRYRMSKNELLKAVKDLDCRNIKTVVLQSGEDSRLDASWLEDVILEIKSGFDMAITLSVGERSEHDYRTWKNAGADRYLLKIETSDEGLYSSLHPHMDFSRRLDCLRILKGLGYQTGSGNIIGLPGQTPESIARDIIFFKRGDFDMIGIGPFIPHQSSSLAGRQKGDPLLSLKTVALTRIVTRDTHIPATTALGSLERDYRMEGLKCGANVLMPNFTPRPFRDLYEIYPGKKCVDEPVGECDICTQGMAEALGRFIDHSRADSLKMRMRQVSGALPR